MAVNNRKVQYVWQESEGPYTAPGIEREKQEICRKEKYGNLSKPVDRQRNLN